MRAYLKYVGDGTSLQGVPARDLSEKEAAIHGERRLLASGLYKKAGEAKQAKGPLSNKAMPGGAENK